MEIYCEKFSQKRSILDVWLGSKFTFAGVLTNLFLMKVVGKKEGKKYWTESKITYTAIQKFQLHVTNANFERERYSDSPRTSGEAAELVIL